VKWDFLPEDVDVLWKTLKSGRVSLEELRVDVLMDGLLKLTQVGAVDSFRFTEIMLLLVKLILLKLRLYFPDLFSVRVERKEVEKDYRLTYLALQLARIHGEKFYTSIKVKSKKEVVVLMSDLLKHIFSLKKGDDELEEIEYEWLGFEKALEILIELIKRSRSVNIKFEDKKQAVELFVTLLMAIRSGEVGFDKRTGEVVVRKGQG